MKVNIEALNQAIFREWEISLNPDTSDYPKELEVLVKHLEYSMKDITEYNELTEEEKKIISPTLFNAILLTPDQSYHKELKEETRDKITQLLIYAQNEGLETTDLQDIISKVNQDIPTL